MRASGRIVLAAGAVCVLAGSLLSSSSALGRTSAAALAAVPVAATPSATAAAVYNRMTQAQRIGQLFMVGGSVQGPGSATTTAISNYHIGNLILTGRATAGGGPPRGGGGRRGARAGR